MKLGSIRSKEGCYYLKQGRWYYRGAKLWRWTLFKSFAATLPESFWKKFVLPRLDLKTYELISINPKDFVNGVE